MGRWKRSDGEHGEADRHQEPIVIDPGLRKEFEVDLQVQRLQAEGLAVQLLAQSENPRLGDLFPKHCRVYVQPPDEPRVRAELRRQGIAVRRADTFPGLTGDHLRVAVRPPQQSQVLVDALRDALYGSGMRTGVNAGESAEPAGVTQ